MARLVVLFLSLVLQIPLSSPFQLQLRSPGTLAQAREATPFISTLHPKRSRSYGVQCEPSVWSFQVKMQGLGSLRSAASGGDSAVPSRGEEKKQRKILGSRRLRKLKTFLEEPRKWSVERAEVKKKETLLGSTTLRKAKSILAGQGTLVDKNKIQLGAEQPVVKLELPSSDVQLHKRRKDAVISRASTTKGGVDSAESVQELWLQETLRIMAEEDDSILHSRASTKQPAKETAKDIAFEKAREELMGIVAERPLLASSPPGEQARFLTLYKGDVTRALQGLSEYYEWLGSSQYGAEVVGEMNEETPGMRAQLDSAKCYLVNKLDKEMRPVVITHVDRHDPSVSPLDHTTLLVVHLLFECERRLVDVDTGRFSIVFDLGKARYNNVDLPLIQRFVNILTDFYPERLGVMLLYDAPGFFPALCWPLIKPCLNPVTRSKVHFVSSSAEPSSPQSLQYWLGAECLPVQLGGEDDFDYSASIAGGAAAASK